MKDALLLIGGVIGVFALTGLTYWALVSAGRCITGWRR